MDFYDLLVTGLRGLGYFDGMAPEEIARERNRRADETHRFVIALAHDIEQMKRRTL